MLQSRNESPGSFCRRKAGEGWWRRRERHANRHRPCEFVPVDLWLDLKKIGLKKKFSNPQICVSYAKHQYKEGFLKVINKKQDFIWL